MSRKKAEHTVPQLAFFRSLHGRFMILMIVLALLPMIVVNYMGFVNYRNGMEQAAFERLATVRDDRSNEIDGYFQVMRRMLETLARQETLQEAIQGLSAAMKETGIEQTRKAFVGRPDLTQSSAVPAYSAVHARYSDMFAGWRRQSGVEDLYLVDAEGNVVFSIRKTEAFGANLNDKPYSFDNLGILFRTLTQEFSATPVTTDLGPFSAAGGQVVGFMGNHVTKEGASLGAFILQYGLRDLDEIILDPTGLGQTGETYLIGPEGLLRTNIRLSSESLALQYKVENETARRVMAGEIGLRADVNRKGSQVLTAYRPLALDGLQWGIVTQIDRSEAEASAAAIIGPLVSVGLAGGLLIALIAYFVAGGLSRNVRPVVAAAMALTTGDLTQRTSVRGDDEIGVMARTFNTMADGLGGIARRIVDSAAKLASSATEINATANQMSAGAESQAEQVIRTSTSMEEMSAAIQEVARNARSTAEATSVAVTRARDGSGRIQATLSDLDETNQALQRLKDRSAEIDRLVALIGDIAAQTNLLALNAAIEAAGAGAAGARFDVVAEEIRKLAQRSAASSDEIAVTVAEVRRETERAAERMASTSAQAQAAGASLDDIVSGIASVDGMVAAITTSTDQQARAAEQVAEALQWITQVTQQTVQAARETAHTTDDLALLAQDMRSAVQQFKL